MKLSHFKILALACCLGLLSLPRAGNAACGAVTSATLRYFADNLPTPYLNGVTLSAEQANSSNTMRSIFFSAAQIALLVPSPQLNVLAFQVDDSVCSVGAASGNGAGVSYELDIVYASGCSEQHVVANSACAQTRQSGIRGVTGLGWPSAPWWSNTYTVDSTWDVPFVADRCYCGSCVPGSCPGTNWGQLTGTAGIMWAGGGVSDFWNTTCNGRQLYRQVFEEGVSGCPASTMTYTVSPTPSVTPTATLTRTQTFTFSPTLTRSPTITSTVTPALALVKSSNVSQATIGDTITFCLAWSNDSGVIKVVNHWDTIPSTLTYVGCSNSCTKTGSVVSWSVNAAIGASGQACFWGKVNGYPWLPSPGAPLMAIERRRRYEALYLIF
jgi:uncharacterized repeat protein (TIGR01451 family)